MTASTEPRARTAAPPARPSRAAARAYHRLAWPVLAIVALTVVIVDDATGGVSRAAHPELGPTLLAGSTGAGVTLIFVVTAVEICRSMSGIGVGPTVRARLVRTLPAYWVACLLVILAGSLVTLPGSVSMTNPTFPSVVDNLLLVPRLVGSPMIDVAFWVVTVQILACAAAAVLWAPVQARSGRLHVVVWLLVAAPVVVDRLAGDPAAWPALVRGLWAVTGGTQLYAWAIGIALWCLASRRLPRLVSMAYLAAGVAAATLTAASPTSALVVAGAVALTLALLMIPTRVAAPRLVRRAADLSMPVFLVHHALTVAVVLALVDAGWISGWAATAALLAGPWLLGIGYWFAVYAPVIRWLDGTPRVYG